MHSLTGDRAVKLQNWEIKKASYTLLFLTASKHENVSLFLCFALGHKKTKCPFMAVCCGLQSLLIIEVSNQLSLLFISCSLCLFMSLGAMSRSGEIRRACLMPLGSTPCFPCVPGVGRQLKVQTETHSLMLCMARAQRLRGLSAPPTTRIAHSS